MLSRVAESTYWLARYIERAENIARVVDVNLNLMLDLPGEDIGEQWEPLLHTLADLPGFLAHYEEGATKDHVVEYLTFHQENPNSILRCVQSARENARAVRQAISSEMWEQLNKFYLFMTSPEARAHAVEDTYDFYKRIRIESHLFVGITDSTMSHGEGWHWARLGRMLERADKTSRILDVKYFILLPSLSDVGTPFDNIQWSALLRSASALEMYRKRYGRTDPERVAEFLILDRDFPRSIRHCLAKADESLRAVTGSQIGTFQNPAEQSLGRLLARLTYARIDEIIASGLHEFLDTLQLEMNTTGDAIFDVFFALAPTSVPARPIS